MLKKLMMLAGTMLTTSAFAGDVRTLYPGGTPAQQMHANGGGVVERRSEARPYSLTGERRAERNDERQRAAIPRFNWQAGSAHFRPGK